MADSGYQPIDLHAGMGREILRILGGSEDWQNTIRRVLAVMKSSTGVDAVGIRLQVGKDFPYAGRQGFSDDFIIKENSLLKSTPGDKTCRDRNNKIRLGCTCGLVISGKTDPSNPLFTQGGSAWSNDLSLSLDFFAYPNPGINPPNECIRKGYASIALVPIRARGGQIVGLLQFNDRQKGRFTLKEVEVLEGIAANLGEALLRKRSEESLRESKILARTLLDATHDLGQLLDEDGIILDLNEGMAVVLGGTREELIGTCVFDRFTEEDAERRRAWVKRVLREGKPLRLEDFGGRSGRFYESTLYPIATARGEKRRLVVLARDITERKRAEESRWESEQFALTLLEATNDLAHLIDEDGKILNLNERMATAFCASRENLIGTNIFDKYSKKTAKMYRAFVKRALRREKPLRIENFGERSGRFYESTLYPIETVKGEKRKLLLIARDITERKKAEAALRESSERLEEAQRIAHLGNWTWDIKDDRVILSEEGYHIFGFEFNTVVNYARIAGVVHPEDRTFFDIRIEGWLKNKGGDPFEYRIVLPNGRIKHLFSLGEVECDATGVPVKMYGTLQDITADRERIRLLQELAHLNRIMQVSEISACLAHEINQPLGAILNNASAAKILISRLPEIDGEIAEILEDIVRDANRASQIVGNIRTIVKKEKVRHRPLNMNVLIEEVVELFRKIFINNQITLFLELHPDLEQVSGDNVGLQQVLMNLINNALEAMKQSSSRHLKVRSAMEPPDMVTVSVSDSGAGIDAAITDRLFEPFITTKKDGMGLGLRISGSIVEEHGGRLWFANNPDAGATFYFSLKACRGESI